MSGRDADASGAQLQRADAEARRRAQRLFERPLVLDAGAGTGKTTVLVARCVVWCVGPGWQRHAEQLGAERRAEGRPAPADDEIAQRVMRRVVAITFTEAAAAEMATRVGASLLALQRGECPLGVDREALPAEPCAARARALVAALDQFPVRTIHGFCRRLLASQPLEAGLHPRFQVDADGSRTRDVVREVLERALPEAYAGAGFAAHAVLAEQGLGPDALEEALLELLDGGLPARALQPDPFAPAALARLHASLAEAVAAFFAAGGEALRAARRAPKAQQTLESLDALRALGEAPPPSDLATLASWLAERVALFEDGQRQRIAKWANESFVGAEQNALGDAAAAVAAAAQGLTRLLAHLQGLQPERLQAAREVLAGLLAEVERGLRRRGVESFGALLEDTRRLLTEDAGAARRARGEIDQLLVDEFQDTDRVQCEILAALVLDAPEAERPGLFLVGDPKQSIYGWRSADLAAYEGFVARVRAAGGEFHRLAVNHRSVPSILREVDELIEPTMRPVASLQPAYERLEPCPRLAQAAGFVAGGRAAVEHWVSWPQGEDGLLPAARRLEANELEARAIAGEIAELASAHGLGWSRFALLFRALSDVEVYVGALRERGIPYVVERDHRFYERREIVEASALVRCILDPRDAVALVALLRSAWVGVPDAALPALWHEQLPDRVADLGRGRSREALETARAAVRAASARLPAAAPSRAALPEWELPLLAALDAIETLRRSAEAEAPDVFVERLRALFAIEASEAARHLGPWRLAHLDRFFRDLVHALEESGGDVGAVLSGLRTVTLARETEEGRPRDAAEDAVHVLSIHKSKGLAFDQVFLCQLHKGAGGRPPRVRAQALGSRYEYSLFGWPTPGFHECLRAGDAVENAERVRTLYVAMTRARERLVLCGARAVDGRRRREPDRAGCHAELLDLRASGTPALEERAATCLAQSQAGFDEAGARWVFPALREAGPQRAAPAPRERLADPAAEIAALAAARRAAASHEARVFRAVASAQKPALAAEAWLDAQLGVADEEAPSAAVPGLGRELAMAVGTAVHAALEELDPAAPPEAEHARCRARAEATLVALASPDQREAALARVHELLERFFAGPLAARFARIAPGILARELPLLEPGAAQGEGPVGFTAGAIDLVYRDPESAQWVVADWKTDAVRGAALRERAAGYAGQGRLYTRALRDALALEREPRFELWFLDAGEIVSLGAPS